MAGSGRGQGSTGQGDRPLDRASPQVLPAHLPPHLMEFLQSSDMRPRAVPPPDAPQGPNEANSPLDIINESQLLQWATEEPAQLLAAIDLLRTERDLGRETAEFYDRLPDEDHWKERYEAGQKKRRDLENKLREKVTYNDFLQAQLLRSQQDSDQLRRQHERGDTPASTVSLSSKRSPRLPDVDTLTDGKGLGKGEPTWEEWIHKIHDKLEVNHDHFENERAKIAYVCGRTAGKAASYLYARRRRESKNPYTAVAQVLEDLTRNFDDPDRRKNAVRDYNKLMQGTKTFHDFFSEFIRLASYLDVTEQTLLDDLERKIAPRLNSMWAVTNHTSMTLDQTRDFLIKLDNSQRSAAERKVEAFQEAQRRSSPLRDSTRPLKQVTFRKPAGLLRDASPRYVPNPQRSDDVNESRCFYCHEKGHQASECPKKPRRPTPVNNVEAPSEDLDDDYDRSTSSASDSGN